MAENIDILSYLEHDINYSPDFSIHLDGNNCSVIPQPTPDSEDFSEGLDNLGIQMPPYNSEESSPSSSHAYASPSSDMQSGRAPETTLPVPTNSLAMYPVNSSGVIFSHQVVHFSVDQFLAIYYPSVSFSMAIDALNRAFGPWVMLPTNPPTSPSYPDLSSPSASTSPRETTMTDANVYSDVDSSNECSSSGSPAPSTSCPSPTSISDTDIFVSACASASDSAYGMPPKTANTLRPPTQFNSAPHRNKRKIDVSELEDLAFCDDDHEDGDIGSSDEDEYRPESGEDDSEGDARSRGAFISSKWPSPRVPNDDIQPAANPYRGKKRSSSKYRGPSTKKVFLNDGNTKAVGGFVCGLITQWKGKGGQYTSKGIPTPEVGEVCQMRTRNWSDMIRHQEKTFWHSPPGVCQSCQTSLNGRQDNLHRHGQAACKGQTKGKKVSSKKPSKKARK